MRISVVTVVRNAAGSIEETMRSVLAQTHGDVEYIVIDGESTDGTLEIIGRYADRLAYMASGKDGGIYDAMNKGIAVATGEYINFMNAGDTFVDAGALARVAEAIERGGGADVVYGDTVKHDGRREWIERSRRPKALRHGGAFCHQSAFVRGGYHRTHGFDTRWRYMADFDLFHRAYMEGASFRHVDVTVARYDAGDGASLRDVARNYDELDGILADTDTAWWRLLRRGRQWLGNARRRWGNARRRTGECTTEDGGMHGGDRGYKRTKAK